jgi:hypothetical protein
MGLDLGVTLGNLGGKFRLDLGLQAAPIALVRRVDFVFKLNEEPPGARPRASP